MHVYRQRLVLGADKWKLERQNDPPYTGERWQDGADASLQARVRCMQAVDRLQVPAML